MTENFGAYLKHERELRGVPLEKIAEATKIHMRYLLALEENQFGDLPGEVFIKGYIRAYAKSIGTNADEILNTYENSADRNQLDQAQQQETSEKELPSTNKNKILVVGGGSILFIVMGIAVFGMFTDSGKEPESQAKIEAIEIQENLPTVPVPEPDQDIKFSSIAYLLKSDQLPKEVSESVMIKKIPQISPPKPEPKIIINKENEKNIGPTSPAPKPKKIVSSSTPKVKKPPINETFSEFKSRGFHTPDEGEETIEVGQSKPIEPKKPSQLVDKEVIIQTVPVNVIESEIAENPLAVKTSGTPELELKIQVQGNAWFNMKIDDSREEDFILPGGGAKIFTAKEQFLITIGNKEDTILFLNNQAIALPEGSDRVVREFLINSKLLLD